MTMKWKRDVEMRAKFSMDDLINDCNLMGAGDAIVRGILNGLCGQHRTLQQTFIRVLLRVIAEYGARYESDESAMWFDGRNQGAGQSCAAVAKFVEESDDIWLPTI